MKTSVLRFWETEFRGLVAEKTAKNQRRYSRAQVERVLRVKALLYDEGYTIAGAKRALSGKAAELGGEVVEKLKRELRELLQLVGE